MAFFVYQGDGYIPMGAVTQCFGKKFVKGGSPVEVTDPMAVAKLSGNPNYIRTDVEVSAESAAVMAAVEEGVKTFDGLPAEPTKAAKTSVK